MRRIIHLDMDAFYAAVEVRDDPSLRGKPVIVSGHPQGRGVVAAASYEARRFGVRSAMPLSQARRICPQAIILPTRFEKYRESSEEVLGVISSYTPLVEQVALDEWFLDVTGSERLFGPAGEMAERMRAQIVERTGLTASAGVAPNKFLAKIASDLEKPDGLVIVPPEGVGPFLEGLSVSKIWGVGKVTERALREMGIRTIGELAGRPSGELTARLGRVGEHLYRLARGIDEEPVVPEWEPKSIGHEETFERDVDEIDFLRRILLEQSEQVARRARTAGYKGRSVTVKLRYSNFKTMSRTGTLPHPTDQAQEIFREGVRQLNRVELTGRRVRLLGLSLSGLVGAEGQDQLSLFAARRERMERATRALDEIWDRFGRRAIRLAGPGEKN